MALPEGAELGTTNDPKALILGDKAAVGAQATDILDERRRIDRLLDSIEGLAIPTWQGGIGQFEYLSLKTASAAKFETYRDVLKSVGANLNMYSDALGVAQEKAQSAIDKWNEGERATKAALAEHNAAVKSHNERVDGHNARVKAGLPVDALNLVPPGPFVDPGEALREEAQEILADARTQLNESGDGVATQAAADAGVSTEGSSKSDSEGLSWFKGKATSPDGQQATGFDPKDLTNDDYDKHGWNKEFGDRGSDGEDADGRKGPSVNADVSVVKGDVKASLISAEGETEGQIGDLKGRAKGSVDVLSVGAGGELKVGPDGVAVGGQANMDIVRLKGEASADYGPIGVNAKGEAYVGADAKASVGIGKDGVHAGGEAFVGAKVSGEIGGDVGGVGAGVEAEAWAGAGVAADLDVGMKDGKFHIGGELGAGLGIGAKVGPNVTLDFPKMAETGKDFISDPGKVVDTVTVSPDEIAGAGKSIAKGIGGLFS